ncbi:hypothetical protein BZA05DRAFT_457840 [Tricharina praecox]|uniref:uncharacterized protein n=1 Tax=Tricharina praecox TaxID=43433 RepID=UPI0022207E7A|nr:uncharacterized protein BZA05DRAFT_457840 [Tricharina praecox]KAI5846848.1 hypothetical protein BZA05DRAFT_457840 [Tricharina praecox]
MAGPGDAAPVTPGLTLLAGAGQEPAPGPTAPRKRATRKAGKGKAVPASSGLSTSAGGSPAGVAPGSAKPVGGKERKVATRALKSQASSAPTSSCTAPVASGPATAQAGHATAASGPTPAAPVASGSTVAAVSGEATAAPVGQAPSAVRQPGVAMVSSAPMVLSSAPSQLGQASQASPPAPAALPAKEKDTEEIQYLKYLVASANWAKHQGNLDDLETIFAELLEIRKVHLPMRKDLPGEVHVCARDAQNALRRLGARGTKVAHPAGNSVVSVAPCVSTAQTAAASTSASATTIATKAHPLVAPAFTLAPRTTTAVQQQNQRSASTPPASSLNPSAIPVGTAEMQYLRDLATEARRLANDDGYNGFERIEGILQMLKNIKEADLPRRPDFPVGVVRAVDTILGVVSRCRFEVIASRPAQGSGPSALPVAGPVAAPAVPKVAALPVAGPVAAAPAPRKILLAQEPALVTGPVVAAPAPAPQLLFRQKPVLLPAGPSSPLVPIPTEIGRRPNAVVPLRRHVYVSARQPPLHPRLNQTPVSDDSSALAADAFSPKQKVRVVRGVPRQRALEAPGPAPAVVSLPAIRAWREPSPVVPVVDERMRVEEERRATLYDAVFGLEVSMVLATGYGLVAGLWVW